MHPRETAGSALWEMLPGESPKAFAAFCRYRDLPAGERSVLAAYRLATGRLQARNPPGTWTGWSARHRWKERARGWDRHVDALVLHAHLERRAQIARDLLDSAEELSRRAFDRLQDLFDNHADDVSAAIALRTLEVSARLITCMVALPVPLAQGSGPEEIVQDLIEVFGALALAGDISAAKIVLAAVDRTKPGPRVPVEPANGESLLEGLLGRGGSNHLTDDLQGQPVEHSHGPGSEGGLRSSLTTSSRDCGVSRPSR